MADKLALIILDGWGNGAKDSSDAVFNAQTNFVDSLYRNYPSSFLLTDGLNVGLPEGQMGNSEVGHMNIGAGRIVFQDLVKINNSIEDKSFFKIDVLLQSFEKLKTNQKSLHLIGLIGDGGVHASQKHLVALTEMAKLHGLKKVYIHAFTDGRDTDPNSALGFVRDLEKDIKDSPAEIASLIGRYYAMDRDKRWERVKKAYDLLVHSKGEGFSSAAEGINKSYENGITDEFIEPIVILDDNKKPKARIEDGDTVICFNFRTDRCREITEVLTQKEHPEYHMKTMDLDYLTMTSYDDTFRNINVLFKKDALKNTLGEYLSKLGKTQLRIAETEKYPHVSFFFSGGRELKFEGESRKMIPSPKVATYDLKPEMSAYEVTQAVVDSINTESLDFICLNFANADMVGHTGVFKAIVSACETVDKCLSRVVNEGLKAGYSFVIIADHGNADFAINADGSPNTAHSLNPVPIIVIDPNVKEIKNGILADVAPTILKIMGLGIPAEMTGKPLF